MFNLPYPLDIVALGHHDAALLLSSPLSFRVIAVYMDCDHTMARRTSRGGVTFRESAIEAGQKA